MSIEQQSDDSKIKKNHRELKIGLALGGGGARGWAHIEVIRSLLEAGITPHVVTGTSMGALVGAAYVSGCLDDLADWVERLRRRDVVGFLDVSLSGGFIEGKKLFEFFRDNFEDKTIEELDRPFAAVATRLDNGQELWLREGKIMDAVRASIAVPGFFTPVQHKGRWLVDGGLVNPVPVSVCRVLGADIVIAVSLHSDSLVERLRRVKRDLPEDNQKVQTQDEASVSEGIMDKIKRGFSEGTVALIKRNKNEVPSMLNVVAESIDIMQLRIMRSRMAGDPPEILISPQVGEVGFLEFHRATEAMQAGREAMKAVKSELESIKRES